MSGWGGCGGPRWGQARAVQVTPPPGLSWPMPATPDKRSFAAAESSGEARRTTESAAGRDAKKGFSHKYPASNEQRSRVPPSNVAIICSCSPGLNAGDLFSVGPGSAV